MLERIRLTNFQCHAQLKVKPGKQITAVVGDSDSGKSSLCRGIRWLVLNKPRGSGFIRWGQKRCSVKIRLDGHDIERVKDSKGNRYILDGKEFKAAGNDVPGDIGVLLGMGPENFQQQHDSPFWFDRTPGELAKELNKIVDMGIIDRVVGEVASRLRKAKATELVCKERLLAAQEKLKELDFVADMVADFNRLEVLEKTAIEKRVDWKDLTEAIGSLQKINGQIEDGHKRVKQGRCVLKIGKEFAKAHAQWVRLHDLFLSIGRNREEMHKAGYNRDRVKVVLEKESEGLCPICGNEMKPQGRM